jgi:predicted nucleic acid-binding protein
VTAAADSSVAIAAILADHEAHDQAEDALRETDATIAHVAFETYSVLTRLPPPLQLTADTAASIVDVRLPHPWATLDAKAHASALAMLAAAHVSGGATYDGLIALTALEHDLELLSRDQRATRTYRALGVRFKLLTP